jgi:hypothetical protein
VLAHTARVCSVHSTVLLGGEGSPCNGATSKALLQQLQTILPPVQALDSTAHRAVFLTSLQEILTFSWEMNIHP